MLIISLATASTVLTLNTYKKGDDGEPVPEILQRVFFDVIARLLFLRVKVNRTARTYDNNTGKKSTSKKSTKKPLSFNLTKTNGKQLLTARSIETATKNGCGERSSMLLKDSSNVARSIYLLDNHHYHISNNVSSVREGGKMEKTSLILKACDHHRLASSLEEAALVVPLAQQTTSTTSPQPTQKSLITPCAKDNGECNHGGCLNLQRLMRSLSGRLETFERSRVEQERRGEMKNQWTELARVVDALLGYVFVLTSILLLAYLVLKTPNFRFI